jgi:phosphoketolase
MSVDTQQAFARLTEEELRALDAHWRAANYLAVGQVYLTGPPACGTAATAVPAGPSPGSP